MERETKDNVILQRKRLGLQKNKFSHHRQMLLPFVYIMPKANKYKKQSRFTEIAHADPLFLAFQAPECQQNQLSEGQHLPRPAEPQPAVVV